MRKQTKHALSILFILTVCFLLSVSVLKGQEPVTASGQRGGMGYFMIGGGMLDLEELNARLVDNGYTEFSENIFSMGGGGHAFINRLVIGGEGHALIGNDETSGTYKTSVGAGYGFFDIGYIIYTNRSLRVYPLLGIGGGGIGLMITEQGIAPTFDEVLQDPKRNANLSTGGFLLSLAVGTDYLLKTGEDEKSERGWVFGIRAGYTFTPLQGDWYMTATQIPAGPDLGITGPYLRIMIGGGGIEKKN